MSGHGSDDGVVVNCIDTATGAAESARLRAHGGQRAHVKISYHVGTVGEVTVAGSARWQQQKGGQGSRVQAHA
jgi:hypothetical protein